MKQLLLLAVLALVPMLTLAQSGFDEEVNSELDRLYDQSQNAPAAQQPQPRQVPQQLPQQLPAYVQPTAQPTQGSPLAQPQIQVYKQPTTVIEASPLTESKAEKMRKARQESELLTEQKIVEKLESSRMEDEKRRAEVLFGDKFNQMANGAPPAVEEVKPTPTVVIQDSGEDRLDREAVRQEVTAALDDLKAEEEAKKNLRRSYFSASAGMGEYPDVRNVRGNLSLGFSFGQQVKESLLVEGSFNYGNYHVEQGSWSVYYPRITNMDQYQAAVAVKYLLLPTLFRPMIGVTAAYTYRSFTDIQLGSALNNASSHAIDVGFIAGGDFSITESLALGIEYRYMMNMTSRIQNNGPYMSFSQMINNGGTPIEKLNQSSISIYGRSTF